MPTARILMKQEVDVNPRLDFTSIPVVYNNKLYLVSCHGWKKVTILNLTDRVVEQVDIPGFSLNEPGLKPISFSQRGSLVKIPTVGHNHNESKLYDILFEIDLSSKTVYIDVKEATVNGKLKYPWCSILIYPDTFVLTIDSDIGLIDLETLSISRWSSGWGIYEPWASGAKFVIHDDDLYIFIGRHYAGFAHHVLKFYKKEAVALESTGGGSPRPAYCLPYYPSNPRRDKIIMPLTSGGVIYADNHIMLTDSFGNKIMDIKPNPRGFSYCNYHAGLFILGRDKNSKYHGFGIVADNEQGLENNRCLFYIRLDIEAKSIEETKELLDLSDSVFGEDLYNVFSSFGPSETWTSRPVIDMVNKKLYCVVNGSNRNTGKGLCVLVEIDISDIELDTYNTFAWYIY